LSKQAATAPEQRGMTAKQGATASGHSAATPKQRAKVLKQRATTPKQREIAPPQRTKIPKQRAEVQKHWENLKVGLSCMGFASSVYRISNGLEIKSIGGERR
jgi:hypothetical protein